MTTMELIERGIGHNCLSDAYELGRADVINEIYAKFMNEDKDSILEWLQDNITD